MRYTLLLTVAILCSGCATSHKENPYWSYGLQEHNYGEFANRLRILIIRIESGDRSAWERFVSYVNSEGLDGEYSETYSVACADLARRDPTIYLRHFMNGEERALVCGKRAYGSIGFRGRSLLDDVYASRLYLAKEPAERRKILAFTSTTTKL